VTACIDREARLALSPMEGTRWSARGGAFLAAGVSASCRSASSRIDELKTDLPVAEFLERHFADQQYAGSPGDQEDGRGL